MSSETVLLSKINDTLSEKGFPSVDYRSVYTAALDGRVPAKRGQNGRWTFNPEDAEKIYGVVAKKSTVSVMPVDPDELTLTASYVLPESDVDMLAELAALRLERDKMESRAYRRAVAAARKAGTAPPQAVQQARRSASAIVREAIDAHRPAILAEINELRDALGR